MNRDSRGTEKGKVSKSARKLIEGPISWMPFPALNGPVNSIQIDACPMDIESSEQQNNVDIRTCVTELRHRITLKQRTRSMEPRWRGDDYLAAPVLDCDVGEMQSYTLLLWLHFHPLCPTISTLFYTRIPGFDEGLIAFRKQNPFQIQTAVYGLIPGRFSEKEVTNASIALFARNGHKTFSLITCLPTSLAVLDNWRADDVPPLFDSQLARVLFCALAGAVWPPNMEIILDHLRSFKEDPWALARAAQDYSMEMRRRGVRFRPREFDPEQYEEWYRLVTDPFRNEADRLNFRTAWDLAISFRSEQQTSAN